MGESLAVRWDRNPKEQVPLSSSVLLSSLGYKRTPHSSSPWCPFVPQRAQKYRGTQQYSYALTQMTNKEKKKKTKTNELTQPSFPSKLSHQIKPLCLPGVGDVRGEERSRGQASDIPPTWKETPGLGKQWSPPAGTNPHRHFSVLFLLGSEQDATLLTLLALTTTLPNASTCTL